MTSEAHEMPSPELVSHIRDDRKVIFINLIVLDASSAIDQQLSQKLKGKVCQPLVKVASKAATILATPERVASMMSEKMPLKIVDKMASKGITAMAETVFCDGPYVVLQLQLQSVSPQAMIEAQSKYVYDENGNLEDTAKLEPGWTATLQRWLKWVLSMIGLENQKSVEEEYLPKLIQAKMESIMGDIVATKLETKGMKAVSQVLPETEQARFFYKTLLELQQVKENMRPRVKLQNSVAAAKATVQAKTAYAKASVANKKAAVKEKASGFLFSPFKTKMK